jgi:predicted nucleic acid-binding protein
MTVVIDCNIFVMCLTSNSHYHLIYQALVTGKFNLAVSVDIMLEYEEVIQRK